MLEKRVKLSDILDDITEPLGEEYIYRPKSTPLKSNLINEAKKYKTADEFVKAQDTVYHGTNSKFDIFDKAKINSIEDRTDYAGTGFSFTDDMTKAKRYANQVKMKGNENIIEATIDINPLIINSSFKSTNLNW